MRLNRLNGGICNLTVITRNTKHSCSYQLEEKPICAIEMKRIVVFSTHLMKQSQEYKKHKASTYCNPIIGLIANKNYSWKGMQHFFSKTYRAKGESAPVESRWLRSAQSYRSRSVRRSCRRSDEEYGEGSLLHFLTCSSFLLNVLILDVTIVEFLSS